MKKRFSIALSLALALVLAFLPTVQPFAHAAGEMGRYLSEVRIGIGADADEAEAALAGYNILKINGVNVDLNADACGGDGDKVVYFGYKTTDDPKDAITDLAVMNMEGEYTVDEYEIMFDRYLESQIVPYVDRFQSAVDEYRVNYESDSKDNQLRAQYVHDALNKFIDGDTGKGLGDLLLEQTKYEMGDEAYDELSATLKKEHADIVTILSQANGKAVLMMENLITRASDTSDGTWLERFADATYGDLLEAAEMITDEAEQLLVERYDEDARKILGMWDDFSNMLNSYNSYVELTGGADAEALSAKVEESLGILGQAAENGAVGDDAAQAYIDYTAALAELTALSNAAQATAIHDELGKIAYGDGTMLDFFSRSADGVDVTEIYPIVAAMSDGQRAGLDFVSLREYAAMAMTAGDSYAKAESVMAETSIYDGVVRGIFQKGGAALTPNAHRENALSSAVTGEDSIFSGWTTGMLALTGSNLGSFAATAEQSAKLKQLFRGDISDDDSLAASVLDELEKATAGTDLCKLMTTGCGIAAAALADVTESISYNDLIEYYGGEFSPIPHYMIDEIDIPAYDENGEQITLKNQTVNYKAVQCSRMAADEMFTTFGKCADLNGDVGTQWLALYDVKNENMAPILTSSLLAVRASDRLPASYTTGIHMFGTDSALNLNSPDYIKNGSAEHVYVYYKTDAEAAANTGTSASGNVNSTNFVYGAIGVGTLIAIVGVLAMLNKKKPAAK